LVTLNRHEKRNSPRIWKVGGELMGMLGALPRRSVRGFDVNYHNLKEVFLERRRLDYKLQNLRLLRIMFHTFRHWKVTMIYHRT
jgi:hypothetical protein